MFINLLFQDPAMYALTLGVVVASVVLHELGHALTATWEGDPTPSIRGHLTWNPVVHMSWLGLGMAAVLGVAFGATPVTPARFRHRRWGDAIVSVAGPATNLLLAVLSSAIFVLVARSEAPDFVQTFWGWALYLNIALFLFNMIPVPPFDGFNVLSSFVHLGELGYQLRRWHPWPMILAFVLVMKGPFREVVVLIESGLIGVWATLLGGAA